MNWSLEKITNYLRIIQKRMSSVTNNDELIALKYDYEILLFLLNGLKHNNKGSYNEMNIYKNLCSDFIITSANGLIEGHEELLEVAFRIQSLYFYPVKRRPFILPSDIFYQMIMDFIKNFSDDFCKQYQMLCEGNIKASRKNQELSGANGLCFYLNSLHDAFIVFNDNPRKSLTSLVHEIAHVCDFKQIPNFQRSLNYHFSSFVESYPKFVELVFLDYFKDSDYRNWFLCRIQEKFVNLRYMVKYYLDILGRMQSYDPIKETVITSDGLRTKKSNIDNIVSDLFSYYLFYLFKNNLAKFNEVLQKYYSLIGFDDSKIWDFIKEVDIKEILAWLNDYFNRGVDDFVLRKVMTK